MAPPPPPPPLLSLPISPQPSDGLIRPVLISSDSVPFSFLQRMRSLQEKAEAEQCRAEGASGVHPAGCARVDYRVMDVTDMADYSDGSADSLLDKARTSQG